MEHSGKPDGSQRGKLDDLPTSSNKEFWEDAQVYTDLPKILSQQEAEELINRNLKSHYFVRVTGHQAQCLHCMWGFQLDPGDRIKDGHLYDKEGQLVI